MDRKEQLKSVVTNLVHGRKSEAAEDFHQYLRSKMAELINEPSAHKVPQSRDE